MAGGSYGTKRITDAITKNDTAFDTRIADGTTNRLDIPGTYNVNRGRHRFLVNGTFVRDIADHAQFADLNGKWQITATAGDTVVFGARQLFVYVPNYEALWGLANWAESALEPGHTVHIEFSNADQSDGYAYRFEGQADASPAVTLRQFRNGAAVDETAVDPDQLQVDDFDLTRPWVARCFLNWYGAGLARYAASFPLEDDSGETAGQTNTTFGRTSTTDDVATGEINLRPQVRLEVDSGAPDLTYNICSIGGLIRGNATKIVRPKAATWWDLGGTISQYYTENEPVMAARIAPDQRNVTVEVTPPKFVPNGSVTMALLVGAVHEDHPDLTVNFDDPNNDGTDEGPAPAPGTRSETDVLQWTSDVTAYPTTTGTRGDFTSGAVPDVRELSTVVAAGDKNSPSDATGGGVMSVERAVFPEDVLLFIPRTDPAGSTTAGEIQWLTVGTEQRF